MSKARKIYPAKAQVKALEMNCIAIEEEPIKQEWDNGFEYKAKTIVKVKNERKLKNGRKRKSNLPMC